MDSVNSCARLNAPPGAAIAAFPARTSFSKWHGYEAKRVEPAPKPLAAPSHYIKTSYSGWSSRWYRSLKQRYKKFTTEEKIRRGVEERRAKSNVSMNASPIRKLEEWVKSFVKSAAEMFAPKPQQEFAHAQARRH